MPETKRCPMCAEEIAAAALKCKHCQHLLTAGKPDAGARLVADAQRRSMGAAVLLALLFGPLGLLYSAPVAGFVLLIPVGILGAATGGAALLVIFPLCAAWAALSVAQSNARIDSVMRGRR